MLFQHCKRVSRTEVVGKGVDRMRDRATICGAHPLNDNDG